MRLGWHRLWPRVAYGLLLLVGVAWEVNLLFVPATRVRAAGRMPFDITNLADGAPVGQTFRMLSDGLQSVDLQFSVDRPTSLLLRCRLLVGRDYSQDGWAVVYQWTQTVELAAGRQWRRFSFAPVSESRTQVYQFQVQQIEARAVQANAGGARPRVSVIGSVDDALKDGNIVVGRFQWVDRDLLFQAYGADSAIDVFRLRNNLALPKPLRNRRVQITLLATYTLALAVFAFYMLVQLPELGNGQHDRQDSLVGCSSQAVRRLSFRQPADVSSRAT